jgi:drug/metabolite transporter (DMT)-like permease
MDDETLWKRRFAQLTLFRLASLLIFMAGIAIIFTDVLRSGGAPQPGAVLVIIGALATVLAPKLLKKMWNRQ